MMLNPEDLRRRMARMTDEQLLDIVTVQRRTYRQVAVRLATEELTRRGLSTAPAAASYRRSQSNVPSCAPATAVPPARVAAGDYGFVWFCEIMCAAVGSIVLAVVLVAGRETQKAVLRWAATNFMLPYVVWRGARLLDRRWQGARTGQATN